MYEKSENTKKRKYKRNVQERRLTLKCGNKICYFYELYFKII